jgi:hypothetical protein
VEEIDVEKTVKKPRVWVRRALVILLLIGLSGALFEVLQIWALGRHLLAGVLLLIGMALSFLLIPGSAAGGFMAGLFLADWADLDEGWVAPVLAVLALAAYIVGAVLFWMFVAPGWFEALRAWAAAGAALIG